MWFSNKKSILKMAIAALTGVALAHANASFGFANDNESKRVSTSGTSVSLEKLDSLIGHAGAVRCVAYSPDGKLVASGSEDQSAILWDITSRKPLYTLNHPQNVWCLTFSPDGKHLVTGTEGLVESKCTGGVYIWDIATGKKLHQMDGYEGSVLAVAYSPDGTILAAGGCGPAGFRDPRITLWNVNNRSKLCDLEGHTAIVDELAFLPDGKTLASSSHDTTVKLWDCAARKEILNIETDCNSPRLKISPDGKTLATTNELHKLTLWDTDTGIKRTTFDAPLRGLSFSPNGKLIATGSFVKGPIDGDYMAPAGDLQLWQVDSGERLQKFQLEGVVESVAFSPDGQFLAVGCRGKERTPTSLRLINGKVGPEVQGDRAGTIQLWSVK